MRNLIFDFYKDKTPFGAVTCNENITINVHILKTLTFNNFKIVIHDDFNNTILKKNLFKKKSHDEFYNIYTLNFSIDKIGLYFYYFELEMENHVQIIGNMNNHAHFSNIISTWQLTVYNKTLKTPDWFKGNILYQIFPDRFNKSENYIAPTTFNEHERIKKNDWYSKPDSNYNLNDYSAKDFFMGNLVGIQEKLNYFKSLNINTIYLNPIFKSPENHRYSTADYFNIDPYLGTNKIFQNMIKKFKKKNINFILDGVFSHTGADSIYFNKYNNFDSLGAYNSTNSNYFKWYTFQLYPDKYDCWWGFSNLPTVNKFNKEYISFITDPHDGVLPFWGAFDIAGWRLDVADELPDEFINQINISVKNQNKDSIIIGEVWEDASNKISYGVRRKYLSDGYLDSVMNYPWRTAIIDFVKNKNAQKFKYHLLNILDHYPKPNIDCLMNLLSSHDTQRILNALVINSSKLSLENKHHFKFDKDLYNLAKQRLKIAAFLQFTLPGVPCIYYGDEIGMTGFNDPYNRESFKFENIDYEILNYYRLLTSFRKTYKASFISGFEYTYSNHNLIAYKRNNLLCIVNLSSLPEIIPNVFNFTDFIFGNNEPITTKYGLVVAAKSYCSIKI